MQEAIQSFVEDAKAILRQHGASEAGLERLVALMERLVADPRVLASHLDFVDEPAAELYKDTGRKSGVLYTDDSGLTLVRSVFDPHQPTPVHSHGTWGVVGVYAGRDLHRRYRRKDGGTGAGFAELELIEERVLQAGDVVTIPHPPQDIHAQQGFGGEPCYELVLFGANAMVIPRLLFDLERDTAREVIPGSR